MEWTCRECGMQVVASHEILVLTIGWTGLDGDTGVCTICDRRARTRLKHPQAQEMRDRCEASQRAIAISRAMMRRTTR